MGLEESQEKMNVEGDREKKETQQIRSDGKMKWEENRWKQKRETQDTEFKVREYRAGSIMVHLRLREISFRRGPQAALWKWEAGSFFG